MGHCSISVAGLPKEKVRTLDSAAWGVRPTRAARLQASIHHAMTYTQSSRTRAQESTHPVHDTTQTRPDRPLGRATRRRRRGSAVLLRCATARQTDRHSELSTFQVPSPCIPPSPIVVHPSRPSIRGTTSSHIDEPFLVSSPQSSPSLQSNTLSFTFPFS